MEHLRSLAKLAIDLNVCDGKEIYTGPPNVWFQPVFQCCSQEEAAMIPETQNEIVYQYRGVYIPNVSIDVVFAEGEEIGFTQYVSDLLKEEAGVNEFNPLIYASFLLYHEEGHSVDFATSGLTPSEFIKRDMSEKTRLNIHFKHILSLEDPEKSKQLKFWYLTYNLMRAEEYANEYAMEKIATNLEKILSV